MGLLIRHHWNSLRPVITGWLAVLMLLPSLMGLAPPLANAAMLDAATSICAQNLDASGDHRSHHDHDCPGCLTHATAFKSLAAPANAGWRGPEFTLESLAFAAFTASAAASSPPLVLRARGPPATLPV